MNDLRGVGREDPIRGAIRQGRRPSLSHSEGCLYDSEEQVNTMSDQSYWVEVMSHYGQVRAAKEE